MELEGFIECSVMLQGGVYALVHRGKVVYVGKSKTLIGRIYSHRINWGKRRKRMQAGVNPAPTNIWEKTIKGILFDAFWVRPCPLSEIDALEYKMINLYKPEYNERLKNGIPVDISELVAELVSTRGASAPLSLIEPVFRRRL